MTRTMRALRIAVIAPVRYPIRQPHAGGLESSLWHHVRLLRERGHEVTFCATEGSDFLDRSPDELILPTPVWSSMEQATDSTYPPGYLERSLPLMARSMEWLSEHADEFDVIDNHCLHRVPLDWADRIGVPMISTLHTPPLPDLVAAHTSGSGQVSEFLSVSEHTRSLWAAEGVPSELLPGGVDTALWPLGVGSSRLVWTGRIVPEKGVHIAIEVARRLGRELVIAGRVGDVDYAERELWPQLDEQILYAGELGQTELARLVAHSGCALVTPVWEEPFGLVIAEALVSGTPVASFATGGIPEVVDGMPGALLAPPGDVAALAQAASTLLEDVQRGMLSRRGIRDAALRRFGLDHRLDELETLYRAIADGLRGEDAA